MVIVIISYLIFLIFMIYCNYTTMRENMMDYEFDEDVVVPSNN